MAWEALWEFVYHKCGLLDVCAWDRIQGGGSRRDVQ